MLSELSVDVATFQNLCGGKSPDEPSIILSFRLNSVLKINVV